MWSAIADNFTQEDVRQVRRDHNEKLARYRKGKDWETWVEEDELDLEGERTLAEIKNFKGDYNFSKCSNISLSWGYFLLDWNQVDKFLPNFNFNNN